MNEQELADLKDFLKMLDFEDMGKGLIRLVPNYFHYEELPATVQNYIDEYLNYLKSIQ